jgi:predicted RecA/RadA family phage recombinase
MAQTLEAVFYHGGQRRIDHTPSGAAVANGQIVNLGGFIGICTSPEGIADGVLGSLAITGIFKIKKAVGGGITFARGAMVGWNDTTNTAAAAAGAPVIEIGPAIEAAADGDDHVKCNINVAMVVQT